MRKGIAATCMFATDGIGTKSLTGMAVMSRLTFTPLTTTNSLVGTTNSSEGTLEPRSAAQLWTWIPVTTAKSAFLGSTAFSIRYSRSLLIVLSATEVMETRSSLETSVFSYLGRGGHRGPVGEKANSQGSV